MASAAAGMKSIPKTAKRGVRRVIQPQSLATVAGFAGSRVVERALYGMARGTFGRRDGENGLTSGQRNARTFAKVGLAVASGGLLVGRSGAIASGVGVGLMAGFTWHTLNDFGVNV